MPVGLVIAGPAGDGAFLVAVHAAFRAVDEEDVHVDLVEWSVGLGRSYSLVGYREDVAAAAFGVLGCDGVDCGQGGRGEPAVLVGCHGPNIPFLVGTLHRPEVIFVDEYLVHGGPHTIGIIWD